MAVRPLPEQRLNESLGLTVGLRPIGTSEAMADRPRAAGPRKQARSVRAAVVREQSADPDAAAPKPDHRTSEKGRTESGALRATDFDIGQPRRVVDRDVDVLPADAASSRASIAMYAMPDDANAADPFDVEGGQISGVRAPLTPK